LAEETRCLLVVEDDIGIQNQLRWCFDDFDVVFAEHREEAIAMLRLRRPGLVLLDLGLPPDPGGATEGLKTLEQIIALAPQTKVIVITGNDERNNAIKAIGIGAYDYYHKPINSEELTLVVERAYKVYELECENKRLLNSNDNSRLSGIIGSSTQMLEVCRTIEKVAPSEVSTLLLGESGTGKELLARALHDLSPRAAQPMIAINCAAIPDNLLESELFGYEKGAFTGAAKQTAGKIEYADKGTLFLDEVGDMPLELQAKLLRFLQERVLERVGGRTEIPIDVRVITATHKDLAKEIAAGAFREDLFYRISEVKIQIPALREREGDITLLSKALLQRYSEELSKTTKTFSQAAIEAMESHDWPGNVRELENKVKRGVIMADGNLITPADLELDTAAEQKLPLNLKEVRQEAERAAVLHALTLSDHNISKTAKLLGVTRPTLYDIMEKNHLKAKKS